jgi:hypothetical protein
MTYADLVELIQIVQETILENTVEVSDKDALAAARAAVQVLIDEGALDAEA